MKWLNWLLVLVPIALFLEFSHTGGSSLLFVISALALIPLAAVLGHATEEVAEFTGPKIGGLLNATLGNAAELIITIVALREGLVVLVKASIAGSIIGLINSGRWRMNSHFSALIGMPGAAQGEVMP